MELLEFIATLLAQEGHTSTKAYRSIEEYATTKTVDPMDVYGYDLSQLDEDLLNSLNSIYYNLFYLVDVFKEEKNRRK